MISLHMKITCFRENKVLSLHVKDHRCCGYIINRTFHSKKLFYWCLRNELIEHYSHGCLEIQNLSSRVEKYFTRLLLSLMKYYSTLKEKF